MMDGQLFSFLDQIWIKAVECVIIHREQQTCFYLTPCYVHHYADYNNNLRHCLRMRTNVGFLLRILSWTSTTTAYKHRNPAWGWSWNNHGLRFNNNDSHITKLCEWIHYWRSNASLFDNLSVTKCSILLLKLLAWTTRLHKSLLVFIYNGSL